MNNMIKVLMALACVMSAGRMAHAADNSTEFGIEDDLSVLGAEGTWADPDAEIKGFSVFGPLAGPQNISAVPGNFVLRGNLQADATAYFGSSVTVAGYGVFQSTVQMTEGFLKYGSGAVGKVLKSNGDGFVYWGNDVEGAGEIAGTPRRLVMFQADGSGGTESQLQQDVNDTSVTMLAGSSMTIKGAFQADGGVKLNGAVNLGDELTDVITAAGAVTAQNGVSVTGGNVSVTNDLTVSGSSQLGDTPGTDKVAVNMTTVDARADGALTVAGGDTSGNYAAKFYSGANLAAWIKRK